jgi:hypothetical protein
VIDIIRINHARTLGAALLAVSAAVVGPVEPARADTTVNDLSVSSCTAANCSSATITGSLTAHGTFSIPWTIKLVAVAGDCVRLETVFALSDLEIVAVSPSGRAFRNDNGGAGNLSLVKIAPAESGFYTIRVARADGSVAGPENFDLSYGRYSLSNPNCASPTPPALSAVREPAKR